MTRGHTLGQVGSSVQAGGRGTAGQPWDLRRRWGSVNSRPWGRAGRVNPMFGDIEPLPHLPGPRGFRLPAVASRCFHLFSCFCPSLSVSSLSLLLLSLCLPSLSLPRSVYPVFTACLSAPLHPYLDQVLCLWLFVFFFHV